MEKAPAYQRYPKQILGDDKVLAMDWDAYGMHEWFMSLSWQQEPRGTIPNDVALMRRWLRLPPNAVPCSISDHRCPCADHVWRRVYPQLRTAWVECGELTDIDAKTGEFVFPESVRGLGSERLACRGMVRTGMKSDNYRTGNKVPKGIVRTQAATQIERKHIRKYIEDEDEDLVLSTSNTKPEESLPEIHIAVELETFDFEAYVRKIQKIYPGKASYAQAAEEACCRAVEWEAKEHQADKWRRSEAANYILDRTAAAVEAMRRGRSPDKWPNLYGFMTDKRWRDDLSTWETTTNGKREPDSAELKQDRGRKAIDGAWDQHLAAAQAADAGDAGVLPKRSNH